MGRSEFSKISKLFKNLEVLKLLKLLKVLKVLNQKFPKSGLFLNGRVWIFENFENVLKN